MIEPKRTPDSDLMPARAAGAAPSIEQPRGKDQVQPGGDFPVTGQPGPQPDKGAGQAQTPGGDQAPGRAVEAVPSIEQPPSSEDQEQPGEPSYPVTGEPGPQPDKG